MESCRNGKIRRWPLDTCFVAGREASSPKAGGDTSPRRLPLLVLGSVLLGGLCLVKALPAHGQQATDQADILTPADIAVLRSCANPAISPRGGHLLFTQLVPRDPFQEKDGPARSHLYLVTEGGVPQPVVIGEDSVSAPSFSPDGQYLYFLARRDGDEHTSLYRAPVSGGAITLAAEFENASISGYSIHPDGHRVALLAVAPPTAAEKELRQKGFDQEIFEEQWRPVQIWIAKLQDVPELSSRPIAARLPAAEPVGAGEPLPVTGSVSDVQWNHAGDRLLVVHAPTPSVDDSYMRKRILVVDATNGKVEAEVDHAAKLGKVAWSPDDAHVAFIAGRDLHDPREGRLMVVDAQRGGRPRELMPDYQAHVIDFAWQDDSTMVWVAAEGTLSRVGKVSLQGISHDVLPPNPDQGVVQAIDVQGDQAVVLMNSRRHPNEVFRLDLASGALSRLTDSNRWLLDRRFARQETIRWSATDGLELEGVLVYPLDYQEGERYPLIMLVHGGPESHESDGWLTSYSRPGQVGAARGFFVFYPNYRGSTGRGVEFSMMGQADAAGKEFSDLIDGIDHLVDRGLVDGERVGITGGSYGGYASAWGATFYSDRFAASVMFVGISDNISKVGTTDIPEEMFLVHHRKRLWDDWDYFVRSSPIRYVQRNRTPTLILHGKEDPRVHPSQSLELHRHLKTLGQAPVRLVFYEREGHGNRRAASRLDYHLRMLRWMERFLKEGADTAPPPDVDYRAELGLTDEATAQE
ncbi:MAG: hypothetical protein KatS3mg111_1360 [Pirellulaceae bacterium]|nr:MAG: hypothetical protein KatS3mg111_1360 [Pirellulaceae bacterium]